MVRPRIFTTIRPSIPWERSKGRHAAIVAEVGVIDRAQEDLARGEPLEAIRRLSCHLQRSPTSQPALDLLAYTYSAVGNPAQAGAAWFLTSREDDDPAVIEAFAALRTNSPTPEHLARCLPMYAPSLGYPVQARRRLAVLEARLRASGSDWEPPAEVHYPDQAGVEVEDFEGWDETPSVRSGHRIVAAVLVAAMLTSAALAGIMALVAMM